MEPTETNVYVVDDDESVCRAIGRLLRSAGHSVRVFASAADFLDAVPADAGGALVLDLRMPEIDGFGLYRKLRERGSPLRVIFITAFAQGGDEEQGIDLGAVGFLVKPFEDTSLLDLVDEALRDGT
jgi:FixJ family two-component response regulator